MILINGVKSTQHARARADGSRIESFLVSCEIFLSHQGVYQSFDIRGLKLQCFEYEDFGAK